MNVLALETTTMACSVALLSNGQIIERYAEIPQQHAEQILPMIDDVLGEAGLTLAAMDVIGYGQGPGAFTGVRIGVAVAQGLSQGAEIPLAGISSLAIVAAEVLHDNPEAEVCVAQDARMNEVYTARFRMLQGMATLIGEESVLAPAQMLVEQDDLLAGDAWGRLDVLTPIAAGREPLAIWPRAKFALGLTKMAAVTGNTVTAENARAQYLRESVVNSV